MRSSTVGSSVDMAPRSDWLPTSSWSKRTRTGIGRDADADPGGDARAEAAADPKPAEHT